MSHYLLDTSALLAHYRNERGAERVQALFEEEGGKILLASVSLPEFARRLRELGVDDSGIGEALVGYKLLIDEVVSVDSAIAEASYDLIRRLPERLPLIDALISAAARFRSAKLVHRDAHMRAIPPEEIEQLDLEGPTP